MSLLNSTVSGNSVLFSGGGIDNGGPLVITNSTISGNGAAYKQSGRGGGISNVSNATLTITHSTISGNSADNSGGGIYLGTGTLQIGNTILKAGWQSANIFNDSGTVVSHGYNLSSDDGGGFLTGPGDQINTNPVLGSLLNHGGPTLTHALLAGSPALDAGDPNFVPPPLFDQRGPGYDRVVHSRIDIGSFELQP